MQGFWSHIANRAWQILDAPFRRWVAWLTILLLVGGIYWIDQAELFRRRWLALVVSVSLALFLVRAFKRAVEEHYNDLHRQYVALGDQLASSASATGDTKRHVTALTEYSLQAQQILKDIREKPWAESSHTLRVNWTLQVESYLNQHFRDLLSIFRMESLEPGLMRIDDRERHMAVHHMKMRVNNLENVIAHVRAMNRS